MFTAKKGPLVSALPGASVKPDEEIAERESIGFGIPNKRYAPWRIATPDEFEGDDD